MVTELNHYRIICDKCGGTKDVLSENKISAIKAVGWINNCYGCICPKCMISKLEILGVEKVLYTHEELHTFLLAYKDENAKIMAKSANEDIADVRIHEGETKRFVQITIKGIKKGCTTVCVATSSPGLGVNIETFDIEVFE